jgi:hypothetical protein
LFPDVYHLRNERRDLCWRSYEEVTVYGLIIDNLEEGKSLLAYITNKVYDDLANRSTIFNAMALHEKLSLISIREIPRYKANIEYKEVNVVAVKPPHIRARDLKKHPLLIEQILTEARIPEIIKRIESKTISCSLHASSELKGMYITNQ